MMNIQSVLFSLQDKDYALFQSKHLPEIDSKTIIGIRVPILRKLAKDYIKQANIQDFLNTLPHQYCDENMLHGLLISEMKDYDSCIAALQQFLPYIDNWVVCDIISPKILKKHKKQLLEQIKIWADSPHPYTCRFALEMLMTHFLDDDFQADYLTIPAHVQSDEYYVKMMQAWFFATALAKQWDSTVPYLQNHRLAIWVHNKTIQKARESLRISDSQKQYLKTLKR